LAAGFTVQGAAIIVDATGTTVVEPKWCAQILPNGELLLERSAETQRKAVSAEVDPTLLSVFNHRFMSIAEQMGITLEHTAHSVNIKERRDYSCALFDAQGRLVANAPHIPVHLGSMGESVRAMLEVHRGKMDPGDVFVHNDPFSGGTHLPDITVITPIFAPDGTSLIFVVASRGHHGDIGGATPGSMPPCSKHIDNELFPGHPGFADVKRNHCHTTISKHQSDRFGGRLSVFRDIRARHEETDACSHKACFRSEMV